MFLAHSLPNNFIVSGFGVFCFGSLLWWLINALVAVIWFRRLASHRRDKVALKEVLLRGLRFSPVSIIPPWLTILVYYLGDESRLIGGRGSETFSPQQHEHEQQQIHFYQAVCHHILV
jgi:hypothetical protein